jgi:hypothetical protein
MRREVMALAGWIPSLTALWLIGRAMANRTGKGQWKPGQSGNPGGRPANRGPIIEYADQFTTEAIDALMTIVRDGEASRADKIRAAEIVMDRARGKPTQHNETTVRERDAVDELMDQIDGKGPSLRAVG